MTDLKTTVKVEEVDKDWVHRIDLQAITEFCQSATRIQKILGAPESLNDEALHLLITAAEKVEPLSPLHGSANDLWAKAWEKPWPTTKSSISIEEIPQNVEGEPMLPPLEDDDDNQWDYTVLSDIKLVVAASGASGFGGDHDILVIRPEYDWLQAKLEELYAEDAGVVVSGHQGIEEYMPLAGYWALTDCNDFITTPCSLFRGSKAFIIQVSSPRLERWKEWMRQRGSTVVMSKLPRVVEITAILKEMKLQYNQARHYASKWGPCTRTIIRILSAESDKARGRVEEELSDAALVAARAVCTNPAAYTSVASRGQAHIVGSPILFAHPYRPSDDQKHSYARAVSTVPTRFLDEIFDVATMELSNLQALELFKSLSSHSFTRQAGGRAFELRVHEALCLKNVPLNIRRTVRPAESPVGPAKIKVDPGNTARTIQPSQKLLSGTVGALAHAADHPSFYWVPSVANFPGIDSVLADQNNIYAIQATISDEYSSPGDGLKKVWQSFKEDVRTRRAWHLVVVSNSVGTTTKHEANFAREGITLGRSKVPVHVWGCVY
ncbi:hypothetical protein EUX98_g6766 [Antrodiella citrinella]|uniref:Uncharacterized protein n=1 Tax=Antrodiella citrinella TaxID=2447956 RepID=A0A4S4MN77_9APHY|nr:hypothetical protein EUX98_g6766 [Antrodiella citrinella]